MLYISVDIVYCFGAIFLSKVIYFLTYRYLWRGKHTFAIAQHKHHRNIYEEADSNKRRKRYARPLIDLHMKIYRYEGLEPWSEHKKTLSGKINNYIKTFSFVYVSIHETLLF